jgi:phosphatidate cytidylyltransferase
MYEAILTPLQSPLTYVLSIAWGFLVSATAFVYATYRQAADSKSKELRDRICTWWWIVTIVTLVFAAGTTASVLFIAALSFLSFCEFHSVVPVRRADRVILGFAYLAIPIQYFFVLAHWYGMFSIFVPVYAFAVLSAATVATGQTQGFIRSNATLQWALMLTVYNISHLAFLAVLPIKLPFAAGGLGLLLFALVVVQFNDVAQFFWGRLFGGARIVPTVSPNKTWAGFIGGVLSSMCLACALAPWLTPFSPWAAILIGFALALSGFVGDITLSAIKRDLGIKDLGDSLPGHGGILDRIDSLTLAAPIGFHIIRFFYGV